LAFLLFEHGSVNAAGIQPDSEAAVEAVLLGAYRLAAPKNLIAELDARQNA
jgi:hypothetical protein